MPSTPPAIPALTPKVVGPIPAARRASETLRHNVQAGSTAIEVVKYRLIGLCDILVA